ncbi:MAG: nitrous oxide reductase family maturation protein NosD [Leptospiraceae bacterium]|nr:nitrous oxide reductase family maturation protein NosD [Leptospiraceae bacterium]MCK6382583.1 nitrous oxide reductase family maturation protein NosD [Leptospiraceae bacterium]NUM42459.1 nitrous oxide reductase family maturation protein NosD [Leptospiraceae bacterium]
MLYLLFFIGIFSISETFASTLIVDPKGKISTITEAIQLAKDSDTIEISPGTYSEGMITITKKLRLIAKGNVIVDGQTKEHVISINADNVRIEGMQIMNSGVSSMREFAGIHVKGSKNCELVGNKLINNAYGFYLEKSENCLIENNESIGNAKDEIYGGNGIHLWSASGHTIKGNTLNKHRDGLYFEFSSNLKIENNSSSDSIRYGMHFMFSHENVFRKNKFFRNSSGVAIMYSRDTIVEENTFEQNWGSGSHGILLKEISTSRFYKNIFKENAQGIYADNANRNIFSENQFLRNGWAINILGNCEENKFERNNFIENVFDLGTNSRDNSNDYTGNYWDKYRGFDMDKDGVGDKPHTPVQFFGYWVNVYPVLTLLFESPIVEMLEIAEKAFPVISPVSLLDSKPSLRVFQL